jgi:transposase InsO family protein
MKGKFRLVGLDRICRLLGVTRQSYYQYHWRSQTRGLEQELVLKQVHHIRKKHRHMGGRKLYGLLSPFMREHRIKMGRDALFDLLSAHFLLVSKKRKQVRTTQSFHWLRKYPNLIKALVPTRANQLWVSDITYWKIEAGFVYISFITDAYSRKVVGYHVAQTMEAVETAEALKMALKEIKLIPPNLIHHSDRGLQYCSGVYVNLLQDKGIHISMTENGDPLENAIAERLNGILKGEYLEDLSVKNIDEAKVALSESVWLYNQERPHLSIGMLTPQTVHIQNITTKKLWKNYFIPRPKAPQPLEKVF